MVESTYTFLSVIVWKQNALVMYIGALHMATINDKKKKKKVCGLTCFCVKDGFLSTNISNCIAHNETGPYMFSRLIEVLRSTTCNSIWFFMQSYSHGGLTLLHHVLRPYCDYLTALVGFQVLRELLHCITAQSAVFLRRGKTWNLLHRWVLFSEGREQILNVDFQVMYPNNLQWYVF